MFPSFFDNLNDAFKKWEIIKSHLGYVRPVYFIDNIEKLLVEPIFVRPNVHLDTLFDEFKKKDISDYLSCFSDDDYKKVGAHICEETEEVYANADITVETKDEPTYKTAQNVLKALYNYLLNEEKNV